VNFHAATVLDLLDGPELAVGELLLPVGWGELYAVAFREGAFGLPIERDTLQPARTVNADSVRLPKPGLAGWSQCKIHPLPALTTVSTFAALTNSTVSVPPPDDAVAIPAKKVAGRFTPDVDT
jgi:hypothetical protein